MLDLAIACIVLKFGFALQDLDLASAHARAGGLGGELLLGLRRCRGAEDIGLRIGGLRAEWCTCTWA